MGFNLCCKIGAGWRTVGCVVLLLVVPTVLGEFAHGKYFHFINHGNNLCLTANANDFRTEIGVFLGQVTLEECDFDRASQKWAVILWSEQDDGKKQYWFYPMENGLNEFTSALDEDGIYPVNNFIEVSTAKKGRTSDEFYIFKSLEYFQCTTSQGKGNPITYETCDARRGDQQWKLRISNGEPLNSKILDRSLMQMSIDLFRFTLHLFFPPTSDKNSKFY